MIEAMLATARARLGRVDEARRLLARASSLSGKASDVQSRFGLGQAQAHLAWAEGDWTTVWATFEQCANALEKVGFRWLLGYIWREWAEAHLERGEAEDIFCAREILERALELYQACGMAGHAGRVQARLENLTPTQ